MQILTSNKVFMFYGTVTKGVYPEADPSRELYKIVNEKGTYYAVTNGFDLFEVDAIPEGVEPYKYCYTAEDGFYENPDWQPSPEERQAQLEETIDMLVVEMLGGK